MCLCIHVPFDVMPFKKMLQILYSFIIIIHQKTYTAVNDSELESSAAAKLKCSYNAHRITESKITISCTIRVCIQLKRNGAT